MKTIGFLGAYDKTDMLLNLAKVLTLMNSRVLLVDSTINQKAKYVVPTINPTLSYITSFEDIDVAIGFSNLNEINDYIGEVSLPYDIVLVDCDIPERISTFNIEESFRNYFVTSFDMYSLRKGMEILDGIEGKLKLTKILFARNMLKEDDDYLNFISMNKRVEWDNDPVYFPLENGDLSVIAENQRVEKIKFKRLSTFYKESISFLAQQILDTASDGDVRRAIRTLEKQ